MIIIFNSLIESINQQTHKAAVLFTQIQRHGKDYFGLEKQNYIFTIKMSANFHTEAQNLILVVF